MPLYNIRTQHPVGQGFFHSGELQDDSGLRLRYVFDCGAMHKYKKSRERCIDDYIKTVGPGSRLDLLFISHIHADHVNGLNRLLKSKTGLKVETIVLPLINVQGRLISYARTLVEDPTSARDGFYRDFILDPRSALARFGPRRIIFVRDGDDGSGAPGSRGPERPFPDEDYRGIEDGSVPWKLFGSGDIEQAPGPTAAPTGQPETITMPDTRAFSMWSSHGEWLLSPFVDPTVSAGRRKFMSALAKRLGIPTRTLTSQLNSSIKLEALVKNGLDDLKAAYNAIAFDLNVTSLCLYSGPLPDPSTKNRKWHRLEFASLTFRGSGVGTPIAWLCTGDAALKQPVRANAMINHYGKLLNEVVTVTLPHHGSDNNFPHDMPTKIGAKIWIASADAYKKWRHPGTKVVQAVNSAGRLLLVTTSQQQTAVEEMVVTE